MCNLHYMNLYYLFKLNVLKCRIWSLLIEIHTDVSTLVPEHELERVFLLPLLGQHELDYLTVV